MLRAARATQAGLTIIELMGVMACVGILVALTLPGFSAQMRQARRSDAFASMTQIQQAQERHRGREPRYAGSLNELFITNTSGLGYYQVSTQTDEASNTRSYSVIAVAIGSQTADTQCKYLRVQVQGGFITQSSGPTDDFGNDATSNRACWRG